jgi:Cu2+-exporting ATPase
MGLRYSLKKRLELAVSRLELPRCMQVTPEKTTSTPEPALETIALDVSGMKCAGCVRTVENQLTRQSGVVSASVNLVTEVALVEYEPGSVDPSALAQQLTEVGFPTQLRYAKDDSTGAATLLLSPAERHQVETRQLIQRMAIAATLLLLSAIGHLDQFGWFTIPGLSNIWFHWGLATLALIGPGRSILVDGWRGLRHNAPNMNTLVGLGTLTAYTASLIALLFPNLGWECFFDEPVMLVGFILLGRTLEQQARNRAAASLHSLMALQPVTARLTTPEAHPSAPATAAPGAANYTEVPADRVKVGEWLQVLPGEKIPVDGAVVFGQTTVDESMLTGEAMPVLKQSGDAIAAGSLNLSGAITLKATRTGNNTTLSQIIALVEAAQTRKAPIQGLADTVAGYFTYGVMAIAAFTFLFWYFIGIPLWADQLFGSTMLHPASGAMGGGYLMHHLVSTPSALHPTPLLLSLKLAIAVLVIACPCALGLATPTAILVGSGIGAEHGLLIRGGDILERVHHLRTVVFDKTGTLTAGHPVVTDTLSLVESLSASDLLQLAATVESGTQHPLANAIQTQAQQQELPLLPAQDFHTQPGLGISAQIDNQTVILGSLSWLNQYGIGLDEAAQTQAQALEMAGKTIVYVGVDGTLAGLIAAKDMLRPDAKQTVDQLKQMGLRVFMLTGDQPMPAEAIAQSVGIEQDRVLANVRPDEKGAAIARLQEQGQQVAMIGDGINDAPALAQADVGIALYSGTDVAIETADIVLMRDHLSDVTKAIRLSRATFNKIRQNLFWAFIYNILGIPIAAGMLLPTLGIALNPATAGAFMAFSSVSVVTNSLLLRRTFVD